MKYLYILLILIIFIFTGCTQYVEVPVIETRIETVIVTETVEVENTERIDELEIEVQQYQDLIGNLNELLKNVYYGHAENENWILDGFTAFSIEYKGKYYLITVGHCVENEYGRFKNLGFRDYKDNWVYPNLLDYNNDYDNEVDYAIFTSSEIDSGFKVDLDDDKPLFILGIPEINTISDYYGLALAGESGSPIVDVEGEVTEIVTTSNPRYNTDINTVLEVIDNLK